MEFTSKLLTPGPWLKWNGVTSGRRGEHDGRKQPMLGLEHPGGQALRRVAVEHGDS